MYRWIALGLACHLISQLDKNTAKRAAYNKGLEISQKCKKFRAWDEIVEPFIIYQFAFLIGVSNSFVKGMISDNESDKNIQKSLEELNKVIRKQ